MDSWLLVRTSSDSRIFHVYSYSRNMTYDGDGDGVDDDVFVKFILHRFVRIASVISIFMYIFGYILRYSMNMDILEYATFRFMLLGVTLLLISCINVRTVWMVVVVTMRFTFT